MARPRRSRCCWACSPVNRCWPATGCLSTPPSGRPWRKATWRGCWRRWRPTRWRRGGGGRGEVGRGKWVGRGTAGGATGKAGGQGCSQVGRGGWEGEREATWVGRQWQADLAGLLAAHQMGRRLRCITTACLRVGTGIGRGCWRRWRPTRWDGLAGGGGLRATNGMGRKCQGVGGRPAGGPGGAAGGARGKAGGQWVAKEAGRGAWVAGCAAALGAKQEGREGDSAHLPAAQACCDRGTTLPVAIPLALSSGPLIQAGTYLLHCAHLRYLLLKPIVTMTPSRLPSPSSPLVPRVPPFRSASSRRAPTCCWRSCSWWW